MKRSHFQVSILHVRTYFIDGDNSRMKATVISWKLHKNADYTWFVNCAVLYEHRRAEAASNDVMTSRLTRHAMVARQRTKRLACVDCPSKMPTLYHCRIGFPGTVTRFWTICNFNHSMAPPCTKTHRFMYHTWWYIQSFGCGEQEIYRKGKVQKRHRMVIFHVSVETTQVTEFNQIWHICSHSWHNHPVKILCWCVNRCLLSVPQLTAPIHLHWVWPLQLATAAMMPVIRNSLCWVVQGSCDRDLQMTLNSHVSYGLKRSCSHTEECNQTVQNKKKLRARFSSATLL